MMCLLCRLEDFSVCFRGCCTAGLVLAPVCAIDSDIKECSSRQIRAAIASQAAKAGRTGLGAHPLESSVSHPIYDCLPQEHSRFICGLCLHDWQGLLGLLMSRMCPGWPDTESCPFGGV